MKKIKNPIKRGRGRPLAKPGTQRTMSLQVALAPHELRAVRAAAGRSNQTGSTFTRERLADCWEK